MYQTRRSAGAKAVPRRVLLADEVGLARLSRPVWLKEYMLSGMAERVLILAPAPLVGQWRDEMATKSASDCANHPRCFVRSDPSAFWHQPRVIASIAWRAAANTPTCWRDGLRCRRG